MKEKKPVYKKWWFWVIAIVFLSIFYGAANGNIPSQQEAVSSTSTSVTLPEETPEEAPAEPLTTEEQLAAIVEDLPMKCSDLKVVQGTPDSDRYDISYHYDDDSWDETHFVDNCLSDYIDICSKAYEIDGVNNIELYVYVDLLDAKGNNITEKGFAMSMLKENYNTFNWENLKYLKGKYDTIKADSEFIDIHLGIQKNVDFDEVMYK